MADSRAKFAEREKTMSQGLGVVQVQIVELLTADPKRPWTTIQNLHETVFKKGKRDWAVSKAAVSRALDKLEKRGLIERFETEFEGRTIRAVGVKEYVDRVAS
jgi:DNA-binding MarR family transcriptional regulator